MQPQHVNGDKICVCGVETTSLTDYGLMMPSIAESFYKSLDALLPLLDITEFGLSVFSAGGGQLPYEGYIETDILVPALRNETFTGHNLLFLSQNTIGSASYYWH